MINFASSNRFHFNRFCNCRTHVAKSRHDPPQTLNTPKILLIFILEDTVDSFFRCSCTYISKLKLFADIKPQKFYFFFGTLNLLSIDMHTSFQQIVHDPSKILVVLTFSPTTYKDIIYIYHCTCWWEQCLHLQVECSCTWRPSLWKLLVQKIFPFTQNKETLWNIIYGYIYVKGTLRYITVKIFHLACTSLMVESVPWNWVFHVLEYAFNKRNSTTFLILYLVVLPY